MSWKKAHASGSVETNVGRTFGGKCHMTGCNDPATTSVRTGVGKLIKLCRDHKAMLR